LVFPIMANHRRSVYSSLWAWPTEYWPEILESIGKHREGLLHIQNQKRYSLDCFDSFYRCRNNEWCIGITAVVHRHLFWDSINGRGCTKLISSLSIPLGAIPEYHEIGHTERANKMPWYLQASGTYTSTVSRRFTIDYRLTHQFVQAMNVFVNLFGRAGNFSVKNRKSNWRRSSWTDGFRHDSFHFTSLHFTSFHFTSLHFTTLHFTSLHFTSLPFTSFHFTWIFSGTKEGRKIGDSHQKSAASRGKTLPDSLGILEDFLSITFYSPLSRRNVQKSASPNDEQMQFILK
jgi:hypothetical protein